MNKYGVFVLFFTLFLMLFSFRVYADESEPVNFNTVVSIGVIPNQTQWFNNVTSIPSGSSYSSGQTYQFNITLESASLTDLKFNIFNTTQTGGNSVNTILSLTNGILNYSIVDNIKIYSVNILDLPVGNYSYVWNATDSSGQSNFTNYSYTVIPNTPTVTLTNNLGPWSITVSSITINCYSTSPKVLKLYKSMIYPVSTSDSPIDTHTNPMQTSIDNLMNGVHYFKCVSEADTNYSYAESNANLTVNVPGSTITTTSTQTTTDSFTITDLPSSLSINQGESKSTSFKLKNTYVNDIVNVTISLTGIDSSWYSISGINKVSHGTSQLVIITFNIPQSAEVKNYNVTIKAEGKDVLGNVKRTTPSQTLTLTVSPKSEEKPVENVATPQENLTANQTNETTNPTGLSIRPEDLSNIVLIGGFISAALVFIYREKVTMVLTRGKQIKPKVETTEKPVEPKSKIPKPSIKMPKLLSYKLNINLVKGTREVKKEEDKNK